MASTPLRFTRSNRARAVLAAAALAVALPVSAVGAQGHPHPVLAQATLAGTAPADSLIVPLISSGETFDGETFEGIPDGLGIMPVGNGKRFIDIFVAFEQSRVPFSGFADHEDSSVQRARLDLKTGLIVELEEMLPASAGYIRFCSAFMAGPAEGFNDYTFFVNEESNDVLAVTPGAPNADPAIAPYRQAGLSVWLDAATGAYKTIPGMGRHNHENTVVVPGGWDDIVAVSGDDTFSAPSSQLYMYLADSPGALKQDKGELWAFQVTATEAGSVAPSDPFNDANDYLDIPVGETWAGQFIPVPDGIARGTESYPPTSTNAPQASLEAWSNANNVFQFVRVEDIAYDPDDTRTIYFADTGTDRLHESTTTGRLFRGAAGTGTTSYGRIFKMVLNADDPTVVDEFTILADSNPTTELFRNPDNLAVGHDSIMVQEDASSSNDIWRYAFGGSWTKVAGTTAYSTSAETSGIVDASAWLGAGWWVFDVQGHATQQSFGTGSYTVPITGTVISGYTIRREAGQLLLLYVPGS